MKGLNIELGIKDLIVNENPDIVVITESHEKIEIILKNLGLIRINHVYRRYGWAEKFIEVYSTQNKVSLSKTKEFNSIASTSFEFNNTRYLVHGVHFSSKLNKGSNPELHRKALRDYRLEISEVENDFVYTSENGSEPFSIIVGDFNCNPFEDAMNNTDGFHALDLSSNFDKKLNKHKFYLNPSISPMGGLRLQNGTLLPAGSYYYESKNIE